MNVIVRLGFTGLLAFPVLTLSACLHYELGLTGPVSVNVGHNFTIAACSDIHVKSIRVEARTGDERWRELWVAKVDLSLQEGDQLIPSDVSTTDDERPWQSLGGVESGDEVTITLNGSEAVDVISGWFVVDDEAIAGDKWLHPGGALTEDPCESD